MKIAIIGSGISSLGAAYYLHKHHYDITVFEKNNYIGGHSRTFDIKKNEHQTISVDTGFIVFNKQNYPYLVKLFDETGVGYEKSDMSFSATIANGWLEYGTKNIPSMFAQKRNIFRKSYWQMVRDILHFFKNAEQFLEADDTLTLEECLHRMGYSEWFKTYFILAIGGAIWSCPVPIMLKFPAKTFIRFFKNHGLLSTTGQPQWYTVTGGSKNYVSKITKEFAHKIKLNQHIKTVKPIENGVLIHFEDGKSEQFDHVILGCHADEALKLIDTADIQEQNILGAFKFQPNTIYLHSDETFMPKRRAAWASWVYMQEQKKRVDDTGIALTYWMNNLQNIKTEEQYFVTLNPTKPLLLHKTYNVYQFSHPIFDVGAIQAQSKIMDIQGKRNMWFCGAWQRYGFHEDGLWSALRVVDILHKG